MAKIQIASELKNVVRLGVLQGNEVQNTPFHATLWERIEKLAGQYRQQFQEHEAYLKAVRPARDLYRALGIEPTRYRPSSEALLRRILRGKPLYRIHTLVDLGNFCSLSFLLPIGLYDAAKVVGEIQFRLGTSGEQYQGIGKGEVHLSGRPVLVDERGPFGNPSADSLRTAVQPDTTSILLVIFAPFSYPSDKLAEHLAFSEHVFREFCGGRYAQQLVD